MRNDQSSFWKAWMGVPAVLAVFTVLLVPWLASIVQSFMHWKAMKADGWSSEGYRKVLLPHHLEMVGSIALRAVLVATASLAIAVPLAFYITQRKSAWHRRILLAVLTAPFFVNDSTRAFGWRFICDQGGFLHRMFQTANLAGAEWEFPNYLLLVLVLVANTLPICVFPIVMILPRRNDHIWSACDDFGVSPLPRFFSVVLPLASRGMIAGWLCSFALAFGVSVEAAILQKPMDISLRSIINGFQTANAFSAPFALSSSLLLLLLAGGLLVSRTGPPLRRMVRSLWVTRLWDGCRNALARPFTRRPSEVELAAPNSALHFPLETHPATGRVTRTVWSISVHAAAGMIMLLVMAPVLAVAIKSAISVQRELAATFRVLASDERYVESFENSALVAVPIGIANAVISFGIGLSWWNRRWRHLLILAMLLLAFIPPDVHALCVMACSRLLGVKSGSLVLSAFSQLAWTIPFGVAVVFAANSRVPHSVLNAGLELGASRLHILTAVILRLTWPALVSAFIIGVLFSFNDYARS